jgi:hypothetical protein
MAVGAVDAAVVDQHRHAAAIHRQPAVEADHIGIGANLIDAGQRGCVVVVVGERVVQVQGADLGAGGQRVDLSGARQHARDRQGAQGNALGNTKLSQQSNLSRGRRAIALEGDHNFQRSGCGLHGRAQPRIDHRGRGFRLNDTSSQAGRYTEHKRQHEGQQRQPTSDLHRTVLLDGIRPALLARSKIKSVCQVEKSESHGSSCIISTTIDGVKLISWAFLM